MQRKNKILAFFLVLSLVLTCVPQVFAGNVKYDSGTRRDPFVPLRGKDASGPRSAQGFALEGIVYDPPANSLALIGGQPYKIGDTVGEGKIIEIQKDQVTLEVNSEKRTLWIREDEQLLTGDGGKKTL